MPMFSRQAALALALSFAVAACAQPPTTSPANTQPPAQPTHSASAPAMPSSKEAPAMSEPVSAEPERGPAIPVAELRKRIIDLIGSFQSLKDLEREHVEQVLQMPLRKDPEMRMGYESGGKTTEGWGYGVSVGKLDRLDQPSTIIIGLDNDFDYDSGQTPTYCILEFEPLAKELVAMGYEQAVDISKFKGNTWWNFQMKLQQPKETIFIEAHLYRTPGDKDDRYCIKSFEISGE